MTLRHKEVLPLLAEGRSMKEVAFTLNARPGRSPFTSNTMMEQLHVKSSADVDPYAIRMRSCAA